MADRFARAMKDGTACEDTGTAESWEGWRKEESGKKTERTCGEEEETWGNAACTV